MTEEEAYLVVVRVSSKSESSVPSDRGNCSHCQRPVWVSRAVQTDLNDVEFKLICLQCYFTWVQALGEEARPKIPEEHTRERAGLNRQQLEDFIEDMMESAEMSGW